MDEVSRKQQSYWDTLQHKMLQYRAEVLLINATRLVKLNKGSMLTSLVESIVAAAVSITLLGHNFESTLFYFVGFMLALISVVSFYMFISCFYWRKDLIKLLKDAEESLEKLKKEGQKNEEELHSREKERDTKGGC